MFGLEFCFIDKLIVPLILLAAMLCCVVDRVGLSFYGPAYFSRHQVGGGVRNGFFQLWLQINIYNRTSQTISSHSFFDAFLPTVMINRRDCWEKTVKSV